MRDLKIGFFGVKSWEKEIIEREIINLDTTGVGIFPQEISENMEMAAKYDVLSVFIYSKLDKETLCALPNLKMVAARSTGIDHIDSEECRKKKIEVLNVPEYGSNTVAEYALTLLLALSKKLIIAHQSVEEGEFSPEGLTGVDVFGKTLGVVGCGKIGQNMIRYGKGLGMKVLGVDQYENSAMAKKMGFKYVNLTECLSTADFVSLHVPYTKDTYHMINRTNIKLMKKGSFLINTARGPIVETESLLWALNNGTLAGVGLDVVEEESQLESMSVVMSNRTNKDDLQKILSYHLLRDRDDVIFTPHNAFNTKEAIERIIKTTILNINNFIKNK